MTTPGAARHVAATTGGYHLSSRSYPRAHKPFLLKRCTFGTSSSSIPISPFEMTSPTQETLTESPDKNSSISFSQSEARVFPIQDTSTKSPEGVPISPLEEKSTPDPESSTKCPPHEVWLRLSDFVLGRPTSLTDQALENTKDCIKWWIRQRPITSTSQKYTWKLWDVYRNSLEKQDKPLDEDLFISVVDTWRLAVLKDIATPRSPSQVLADIRLAPSEDLYGPVLDVISHMGIPEDAEKLLTAGLPGETGPDLILQSSKKLWNIVLTAWAKSNLPDARDRMIALLDRMKNANALSHSSVLEALASFIETASSKGTPTTELQTAMQVVEEVFSRAQVENELSEMEWLQRLRAWSVVDKHKARELLLSLQKEYRESSANNAAVIQPNQNLFTVVMSAFGRKGDSDSVLALWHELDSLNEHFETQRRDSNVISPFLPSSETVNTVLHSIGKSKDPNRAEKAQALLETFMEHPSTRNVLDRGALNCVAYAWAASKNRTNIERIQNLIFLMRQSIEESFQPDMYTYNALLRALGRSNRPDSLQLSIGVLKEMWDLHREGHAHVKPNYVSYNTVLFTFSRLAKPGDEREADKVFDEMWAEYTKRNDPDLLPNEATYCNMITTWNRTDAKNACGRAHFYFDHMKAKYIKTGDERFQPSSSIYNDVLDSYRLLGDGMGAKKFLLRMLDDYRGGNQKAEPTTNSFHAVLNAYLNSENKHAPFHMEKLLREMSDLARLEGVACSPTTRTYTTVLEGFASCHSNQGAQEAEFVFQDLQDKYAATGDKRIRPNRQCYTTLMNAWAKSGCPDAPQKTTEIFNQILDMYENGDERMKPEPVDHLILLAAWSRSSREDAPARALTMLNEMADRHDLDSKRYTRPRAQHFAVVIDAFAERGDIQNAEAILERLLRNRDRVQPDSSCWNGVLKACLKSKRDDAPELASKILERMHEHAKEGHRESSPDSYVYTTVMEIWRASKRDNAFQECLSLLYKMIDGNTLTSKGHKLQPGAGVFLSLLRTLEESSVPNKIETFKNISTLMKAYKIRQTWAFQKVRKSLVGSEAMERLT